VTARNGLVGVSLVVWVNNTSIGAWGRTVGKDDSMNTYYAQLGMMLEAGHYPQQMIPQLNTSPWKIEIVIIGNIQSALKSLAQPHLQSGQALITSITETINDLTEKGVTIRF
jgi:hypothetical protein